MQIRLPWPFASASPSQCVKDEAGVSVGEIKLLWIIPPLNEFERKTVISENIGLFRWNSNFGKLWTDLVFEGQPFLPVVLCRVGVKPGQMADKIQLRMRLMIYPLEV